VIVREIAGIENLDASIVVTVEGRYVTWTPCFESICRIREPHSEVVSLSGNRPRIQDESFVTQDPGYVQDASAYSIGC